MSQKGYYCTCQEKNCCTSVFPLISPWIFYYSILLYEHKPTEKGVQFLNAALNLVEGAPTQLREIFTVHVLSDLDVQHLKYSFHRRKIEKSVKKIIGKLGEVIWLISVSALLYLLPGREELAKRPCHRAQTLLLKEQRRTEPWPQSTQVQL